MRSHANVSGTQRGRCRLAQAVAASQKIAKGSMKLCSSKNTQRGVSSNRQVACMALAEGAVAIMRYAAAANAATMVARGSPVTASPKLTTKLLGG